jgi:hypothetical protein
MSHFHGTKLNRKTAFVCYGFNIHLSNRYSTFFFFPVLLVFSDWLLHSIEFFCIGKSANLLKIQIVSYGCYRFPKRLWKVLSKHFLIVPIDTVTTINSWLGSQARSDASILNWDVALENIFRWLFFCFRRARCLSLFVVVWKRNIVVVASCMLNLPRYTAQCK